MRKKMNICGKEYDICTSAFTMFLYKKEFKTGMMADISRLQEFATKQSQIVKENEGKTEEQINEILGLALMPEIDNYVEVSLRLAYVFIKCANPKFKPFDDWVQELEEFNIEDSWIGEVTELAVNSFLGQRTNGTNETSQKQ